MSMSDLHVFDQPEYGQLFLCGFIQTKNASHIHIKEGGGGWKLNYFVSLYM